MTQQNETNEESENQQASELILSSEMDVNSGEELLGETKADTDESGLAEKNSEVLLADEGLLNAGDITYKEWKTHFGGSGTKAEPFLIRTKSELVYFMENMNYFPGSNYNYYELRTSVDLSGYEWVPITPGHTIQSFDGNGYTISNVTIVADDRMPTSLTNLFMFGSVKLLTNLTVDNVEFLERREGKGSKSGVVGAVFVDSLNNGYKISNCEVKGQIVPAASMSCFAGIVRNSSGTIEKCKFSGTIDADCEVYGIAQYTRNTLTDCHNYGTLKSSGTVAGIADYNTGTVSDCTNKGNIISSVEDGSYQEASGIVSRNNGEIRSCKNQGTISGKQIYGIVWSNYSSLYNCTNEADLSSEKLACGIAGSVGSGGTVDGCKNTAEITGSSAYGIAQRNNGAVTVINCENSGKITGTSSAVGILGEINFDRNSSGSILIKACTNEGEIISDGSAAGVIGSVISNRPSTNFKIEKCSNTGTVSSNSNLYGASGIAYNVRGGVKFFECFNEGSVSGIFASGIVDSLVNAEEKGTVYTPVVSGCYNTGEVTAAHATRRNTTAGGIAQEISSGEIENCYNTGAVTAGETVGGIVGDSQNYAGDISISNCYNAGTITATDKYGSSVNIGGLIGRLCQYKDSDGNDYLYTVSNCYNMGLVTTPNAAGDCSGELFGTPTYSTDTSLTTTGCYYSKELGDFIGTGIYNYSQWKAEAAKRGIYGVTTEKMKKSSTFVGYDFAEIWSMGTSEYPYPVLSIIGAGDGFRVIYDLGGGKNNALNKKNFTQEDTIILYPPTRTGYTFMGWYKDKDFTESITQIEGSVRANVYVYAKWQKADDELEAASINGSGYAHLLGTLCDDQGKVLKNRGFNWQLFDITDGGENPVLSGSAISNKTDGSFRVATPRLQNNNKKTTLTKRYRIKMTILENEVETPLVHVIESDVNVLPFSYTQSWDLGADIGAKFKGGPSGDIKIGQASLECSLLEIAAGGGFGRHVSVEQEFDNGKTNLSLKEFYSAKLGGSFSFGPNLKLKLSDDKKYNLPSFGVGSGITAGTMISPGLVINDYNVKDNDDADKLGAFLLNSAALSSGNVLIFSMAQKVTGDQDYINLLADSQTVAIDKSVSGGYKFNKLDGLGTSVGVESKTSYTYSTSDRLDANIHSISSSFKSDKRVGLENSGNVIESDNESVKLGNSFSGGAGDSFSVTANNINNYIADDDSITFTTSNSDSSGISFVVGSSKSQTQKMSITYSGADMSNILGDVEPFYDIAYGYNKFLFNSTHEDIFEGVATSDAVGSYKRTDVDAWGKDVSLGLGVPGLASISGSLSGSYEESYVAERGTYTNGQATVLSESDGQPSGTSYTDVVKILNDPLENYYYRALKAIGEAAEAINKGRETIINYFGTTVNVVSRSAGETKDYVVHIFTPNTDASSRNLASYEVASINSISESSDYDYEIEGIVRTVGEPYLIYLTEVAEEGSEEEPAQIDDFPEGDSFELTLSYTAESLAAAGIQNVNDGNLKIYEYNDELEGYECVGGTRDLENKTVKAMIFHPGQYILAVDDDIPVIRNVEISDCSKTPTIQVDVDELSGFGQVSIAIDGNELVTTENYKTYYNNSSKSFTYTLSAEEALANGEHTLSIFLADSAGNGMSSPLEFTFSVYDENLDVKDAKCFTEGNTIRIRGQLVTEGKSELDTEAQALIASVKATVTEVYAEDDAEPTLAENEFDLDWSPVTNYFTGFAEKKFAQGAIVGYKITILNTYGKETVLEFNCDPESGTGVIISGGANNDLWYYMPNGDEPFEYTAAAIKPVLYVFDGAKLLTEKVDYTLSYTANVNANLDGNKNPVNPTSLAGPKITVTGKGNYNLKDTISFNIMKKSLNSPDLETSEISALLTTGRAQKPGVTVTYGKKKLSTRTDIKLTYHKVISDGPGYLDEEVVPAEAGKYCVVIDALPQSNYYGKAVVYFELKDKAQYKLVSKLTVDKIADKPYNGNENYLGPGDLVVRDGKTKILEETVDYETEYLDITGEDKRGVIEIGTVRVKITGLGDYVGSRIITYKITGNPIAKATINSTQLKSKVSPFDYDGSPQQVSDLNLTFKASKTSPVVTLCGVSESEYNSKPYGTYAEYSYVYNYSNNVNAGTATLEIKGINDFYGTVKKTFKINPYGVKKTGEKKFIVSLSETEYAYSYPAVCPKPLVVFAGKALSEGRDYKLTYGNNKAVNDGSNTRKQPTVTVTPLGNYKGTAITCNFVILPGSMEENGLKVSVGDKVYAEKKAAWKSAVTITGPDGKKVAAKENYNAKVVYTYEAFDAIGNTACLIKDITNTKVSSWYYRRLGDEVADFDLVPEGAVIRVTVNGVGNYAGSSMSSTYRIVAKDIGKLSVTVTNPKAYTTGAVKLHKEDLKFTSGKTVVNDVTFEIDESSYVNNVNKGKASVTIYGTGQYGGSKVVTYNIGTKGFNWRFWEED